MKSNKAKDTINDNVSKLIEKKIIKSEKDLEDPTLNVVEKIANELNICIKDIICCYCPHEQCKKCE